MSEAFLIRIATTRIPKRDTEAVGKRIYLIRYGVKFCVNTCSVQTRI